MNINTGLKNIEKMYKNLTYFDQYGGSVMVFFIITIILIILCSYCFIMINLAPIKDDWQNQRCKPYIIPFAGIINKPNNMSIGDFTSQNFSYCTQNIMANISGVFLQPITFITNVINGILNDVKQSINAIRAMFDKIRTFFQTVIEEIMGRVMNVSISLQKIIISAKDIIGKIQGVMTAGLFTTLGAFYTLQALMGAIAEMIITILIVLAAIIIGLWAVPFTWGAASAMTAIFLAISIPMAIILVFMLKYLKVKPDLSIPKIKCFDKDTFIDMDDGSKKKIIDIKVGDILINNNKVTGKIKVNREGSEMYQLNGIIVSDSHIVNYNNQWIKVSQHPDSLKNLGYKEPFLYCLNTSNKTIIINNITFTDWDEIYDEKIEIIKDKLKSISNESDIHKYLDGGFIGSTKVTLKNGNRKEIKNIDVGDILSDGEIVYGIVEIDGLDLISQYKYYLGNNVIVEGGPNLYLYKNDDINENNILFTNNLNLDIEMKDTKKIKKNILYHLLTNKNTFCIDKIKFYDYNSNIDLFFS
jgi:hypothetical protein